MLFNISWGLGYKWDLKGIETDFHLQIKLNCYLFGINLHFVTNSPINEHFRMLSISWFCNFLYMMHLESLSCHGCMQSLDLFKCDSLLLILNKKMWKGLGWARSGLLNLTHIKSIFIFKDPYSVDLVFVYAYRPVFDPLNTISYTTYLKNV